MADAVSALSDNIKSALGITGNNDDRPSPTEIRGGVTRSPFIFTSVKWRREGKFIAWFANPSEITWKIPLRGTDQQTKTGRVTHNWFDSRRGTFYDEPQLTFNFQSGNIMPFIQRKNQRPQVINNSGLDNFYKLLELMQQERFTPDTGENNFISIFYNSNIFPTMSLVGMFRQEDGISFTDSGENPLQVNSWTAGFTVYETHPPLNSANALIDAFGRSEFRPLL